MPLYHYEGRNRTGEAVSGDLEASSENAVASDLQSQGIIPISISETVVQFDVMEYLTEKLNLEQVSLEDLIIFSRQMYALNKAGIPLLQALQGLADSIRNARLAKAIYDVIRSIESGVNLASSLGQHPDVFTPIIVSMVHVGENTGRLDDAFFQIAYYLELERDTRKRIKQATRYPIMVTSAISVALVIINIFVIPQFAKVFANLKVELPIYTRILIGTSEFFENYWWLLLMGAMVIGVGFVKYVGTETGLYKWDRLKLKIPFIGGIFTRIMLARFSRVFAMLTAAGVPVLQSLSAVSQAVGNKYVGEAIADMHVGIERGETFTRTAIATGMFSPLVIQMMGVGESTGSMDEMLIEVAEFYEQEVDYDLKRLSDWIEPILILFMGVLVLVLALGIFLPMWDLGAATKR